MAGRHPLDVFRSSASGFSNASRRRRTVAGRVIGVSDEPPSVVPDEPVPGLTRVQAPEVERSKAAAAAPSRLPDAAHLLHPGRSGGRRPKKLRRKRRKGPAHGNPERYDRVTTTLSNSDRNPGTLPTIPKQRSRNLKALSQLLLYGSCLMIVALVAWIGVQHDWSGGTEPLNKAGAAEVLAAGPGGESLLAGGAWFTVQAASYSSSEKGQQAAFDAYDALLARGYQDVLVTGDQTVDDYGQVSLKSCVLLVGRRRDRTRLETVLASLGAIDDWPTGAASPFADARIVAHPNPDLR